MLEHVLQPLRPLTVCAPVADECEKVVIAHIEIVYLLSRREVAWWRSGGSRAGG